MKVFFKNNGFYILIYIAVMAYVASILLTEGKVQIHQKMNEFVGNKALDQLFYYLTHLGDGLFAIIIAILISFKNVRISAYIILTYIGAGIVSYILKHWIYYDIARPHFVFQYYAREELKLVDGVDMMAFHSFPSGHSLSAFALFFCLLFVSKNHLLKLSYLVLALIAAYSRVYLSQHWLVDIFVGSFIGFAFASMMYFAFYQKNKWQNLNIGLYELIKRRKEQRV